MLINKLIDVAKKENIEIEIFSSTKKQISIVVRNGELENNEFDNLTNYKIKAIYKGKTIKLKTDIIEVDKIINLIKNESKLIDNDDKDSFADDNSIKSSFIDSSDINITKVIEDLKLLDKYRLSNKEVSNLTIQYIYDYNNKNINNSKVSLNDSNETHLLFADIILKNKDVRKTSNAKVYSKKYDIEKFEQKLVEEIENGIKRFEEVDLETNKYKIILTNECVYKLLNNFSFMFYADNINKMNSPLVDKFNKKVFSNKINIIEDPANENLIGKCLFDDEGSKTFYKEIVKDGVFIKKLYDKKTALKENTISTGNSNNIKNLYLKEGNKTRKELEKELNNGIVIYNIEGLHAGINTLTGDISLQSLGYTVKNGKKDKMINMILLSSNLFELLNNVIEIGSDLEFFSKSCGAPSLLINNITIVGKE